MIKVKSIFKKENLTAAAGLGAGSLVAEVVVNKVGPLLSKKGEEPNEMIAKVIPAIPIFAGLLLATSTGILKNVGFGMLASGVSGVAKSIIPMEMKDTLGIGENVMLGSPLMDVPVSMQSNITGMSPVDFTVDQETRF